MSFEDKIFNDDQGIQTEALRSILSGEMFWASGLGGRRFRNGLDWLSSQLKEAADTPNKVQMSEIIVDMLSHTDAPIRAGAVNVLSTYLSYENARMDDIFINKSNLFKGFDYPYREYKDIYTAFMVGMGNRDASYTKPLLVECFRRHLLENGGPKGLVIVMIREKVSRDRDWLIENATSLISKHPKMLDYLFSGLMTRQDITDLTSILLGQVEESTLVECLSERLHSSEKAQQVIANCKQ